MTRFWPLLLIIAVTGCGGSTDSDAPSTVAPGATRQAAALLTPPPAAQPVSLPADEAPHTTLTEWWYYTGHLWTSEGDRYGFEYVIFQIRRGSFPAFYASHFAITDAANATFQYAERTGFDADLETGEGFHLDLDGWEMRGANGHDELAASMEGFAIDLTLDARGEPVLHNQDTGYMDIGKAGGSYYYSRPTMKVSGALTVDGQSHDVTGQAWMDHQWGNFVLVNGGGWDWFSIQLDDGSTLMLFELRGVEDLGDIPDFGTFVRAGGSSVHLPEDAYTIKSTATWTSLASGATYPSAWTITVPGEDLTLDLVPTVPDQELDTTASTGTVYWEGEVAVTGSAGDAPVTGLGYVELTGYSDATMPDP